MFTFTACVYVLVDIYAHFPKMNCRLMKDILTTRFTGRKTTIDINTPCEIKKCFSSNKDLRMKVLEDFLRKYDP